MAVALEQIDDAVAQARFVFDYQNPHASYIVSRRRVRSV
jgi:hypothetical protein